MQSRDSLAAPLARGAVRRGGISLLEVLISMFILMVGLLGVGALIPVGRLEVGLADQYDRAGTVGRAAFREMKIRGFLRPDASPADPANMVTVPMWLAFDSSNNPYTASTTSSAYDPVGAVANYSTKGGITNTATYLGEASISVPPLLNGLVTTQPDAAPPAFALDPWGLATNATLISQGVMTAAAYNIAQFPVNATSVLSTAPALTRITLRASTSATDGVMSVPQAAHIFQYEDDLTLSNAPTGNGAATTVFFPRGNYQKRQSAGDYSWLVTIVPNSPTLVSTTANPLPTSPYNNQQYTVSVVVYYKRPVMLNANVAWPGETTAVNPERVVAAGAPTGSVPFPGGGIGGGEVTLGTAGISTTPGASYLNVKVGQWIMLAGQMTFPKNSTLNPTNSTAPLNVYRWYRVVAADDVYYLSGTTQVAVAAGSAADLASNAPFYRNITLAGPDWPFAAAANAGTATTYAFLCDGVVAVYEKTLPLERTSVFSPQ